MKQRTCPSCKQLMEGDLRFCPFCGIQLPPPEEQGRHNGLESADPSNKMKTVPCLLCGKNIPETNSFCSFCGAERYKSKREKTSGQPTILCAKCKKPNPVGTKFCIQCGDSLGLDGIEKLLQGRKFTGFEVPLTALAVPLISASDATILSQIAEHQGQTSSFPHRVENIGSSQFCTETQSFKSYRTALSKVLFPHNLPNFAITWILVSVIYALWLTVLTSTKDGNPMVLGEVLALVIGVFFPGAAEDEGSVLTFEQVLNNYIRSLPYAVLITAIILAPSLILALVIYRRNESLIEYRVSPISIGFSFGFSLLVPSVIQPGYPTAREQISTRDLGYSYAIGLGVTESATFMLFLVVLGKVAKLYDLGLPEEVSSQLALAFVFAAWGCLFLTFPLANPLWKSVVQFNKGVYYLYLAVTLGFILFNWLFFSDIHTLIYEAHS
ncbi:MAG: DUF2116 family Zn-ribbon domain-containing protein [Candidatus Heimdallarchaeota archaeon]